MRGQSEAVETPGAAGTDDLVLDVPPLAEHARTARLFAAAAARHFEIDEERVDDLKVAISEACTNAINSHGATGIGDTIRVVASPEPAGVRFSVIDAGSGFDPGDALRAVEGYTPPSGLNEGSLGLALIKALFPTMEIERNAERGMTISIVVET